MAKRNTKPASGTRDFLPAALLRRRVAIRRLEAVFEQHGFLPLETPAFERLETLGGLYGEEGDKLIFKILRRGDISAQDADNLADLALRYDLTVPAARAVAQAGLHHNFRRYQIGPVWRAERAAAGRFREFWQCDVDLYGVGSPAGEVETLAALSAGLQALEVRDYTIYINARPLLTALCDAFAIDPADRKLVLIVLDKLDKIGFEKTAEELKTRATQEAKNAKPIADLAARLTPDFREQIFALEEVAQNDSVKLLKEIEACLSAAVQDAPAVVLDPLLARGLDYYTGFIFEIRTQGNKDAIAGGGRYDDLMKAVSGVESQVCGGSLGLERILALHEDKPTEKTTMRTTVATTLSEKQIQQQAQQQILHMTLLDAELRTETYQLSQELRTLGLAIFTESGGKLDSQLRRANEAGRRWCVLYGSDEVASQSLTLKDLANGTQHKIALNNLEEVKKLVEAG